MNGINDAFNQETTSVSQLTKNLINQSTKKY